MKFFNTDGTEVKTKKDFVDKYKDIYNKQCSTHVEGIIKDLLEKGKNERYKELDIVRLFAWKIAKINHKKSQEESKFVYKSDWKDAGLLEESPQDLKLLKNIPLYKSRSKTISIDKVVSYIIENQEKLISLAKSKPKEFLELLNEPEFEGIGPVYMITLLYFLSGGKYPIYDRFAHAAVKAIYFGVSPDDVYVGYAPEKKYINKSLGMYNEYLWLLKQVFDDYKSIDRETDQALWVYGHGISKKPELKEYGKGFMMLND